MSPSSLTPLLLVVLNSSLDASYKSWKMHQTAPTHIYFLLFFFQIFVIFAFIHFKLNQGHYPPPPAKQVISYSLDCELNILTINSLHKHFTD